MELYGVQIRQMLEFLQTKINEGLERSQKVSGAKSEDQNEERMKQATLEKISKEIEIVKATYIIVSRFESIKTMTEDGPGIEDEFEIQSTGRSETVI